MLFLLGHFKTNTGCPEKDTTVWRTPTPLRSGIRGLELNCSSTCRFLGMSFGDTLPPTNVEFYSTVPSFQGHVLSSRSGRRSGRTPGFDYVISKFLGYLSICVFRRPTEWWGFCWFPFPHQTGVPQKEGTHPPTFRTRHLGAACVDAHSGPQQGSPGSKAGCIRPTGPLATCETPLNSLVSRN